MNKKFLLTFFSKSFGLACAFVAFFAAITGFVFLVELWIDVVLHIRPQILVDFINKGFGEYYQTGLWAHILAFFAMSSLYWDFMMKFFNLEKLIVKIYQYSDEFILFTVIAQIFAFFFIGPSASILIILLVFIFLEPIIERFKK